MSFPRYERYKDSGVEWLGEVPEGWEIKRLKRACNAFPSNVDKKAYEDEQPISLCNYTDVYYNDFITADIDFMSATASIQQIAKFGLIAGDTLITKDSESPADIAIAAFVPDNLPGVVCGYHLSVLRPLRGVHGAFIKRIFDSHYLKSNVAVLANGLTRVGLGQYAIDNIDLPIPPLLEQQAIASFLDCETAKIDGLIAEQENLIALLKEKRQAVISHAVTKGVNPEAPMKDSGVEWLGEIPEDWDVKPLGAVTSKIGSGKTPSGGAESYVDEGILFIRSQNVYDDGLRLDDVVFIARSTDDSMKGSRIRPSDILLNITGASLGRTCVVPDHFCSANVNQHVCIIRLKDKLSVPFIALYMKGSSVKAEIALVQNGAAREGLNFNQIAKIAIPIPPLPEQPAIVDYLGNETSKLDELTSEAQWSIELLKERRSALISAAVTGKIDVRNEYPSL